MPLLQPIARHALQGSSAVRAVKSAGKQPSSAAAAVDVDAHEGTAGSAAVLKRERVANKRKEHDTQRRQIMQAQARAHEKRSASIAGA